MPPHQALQKLKHRLKQLLDHESLFWILPLAFFALLGIELVVILSRLY